MPEPVRLADADPPITSLDDPRVPERVVRAFERLAVRVLARLAREAAERANGKTCEKPDIPAIGEPGRRLAG